MADGYGMGNEFDPSAGRAGNPSPGSGMGRGAVATDGKGMPEGDLTMRISEAVKTGLEGVTDPKEAASLLRDLADMIESGNMGE